MRSRYEEIGGLFRKIREENGLKQSQMAEIADCSLRNYQNIELGITQPGYNILRNIVHNLPLYHYAVIGSSTISVAWQRN